jgi:hypothetical protein
MLRPSSEHTPAEARWDQTLDKHGTGSKPLYRTANPGPNRIGKSAILNQKVGFLKNLSDGIYKIPSVSPSVPSFDCVCG